jgi:hypothetical protein
VCRIHPETTNWHDRRSAVIVRHGADAEQRPVPAPIIALCWKVQERHLVTDDAMLVVRRLIVSGQTAFLWLIWPWATDDQPQTHWTRHAAHIAEVFRVGA